jgi:hypothetical protein
MLSPECPQYQYQTTVAGQNPEINCAVGSAGASRQNPGDHRNADQQTIVDNATQSQTVAPKVRLPPSCSNGTAEARVRTIPDPKP